MTFCDKSVNDWHSLSFPQCYQINVSKSSMLIERSSSANKTCFKKLLNLLNRHQFKLCEHVEKLSFLNPTNHLFRLYIFKLWILKCCPDCFLDFHSSFYLFWIRQWILNIFWNTSVFYHWTHVRSYIQSVGFRGTSFWITVTSNYLEVWFTWMEKVKLKRQERHLLWCLLSVYQAIKTLFSCNFGCIIFGYINFRRMFFST